MGDMSNSVKSGAQSPDSQPCDPKDTAAFAHLSSKDSNKDSKNPESNHYQPQGQSVSASNYVGSYFQPQGQSVSSSNYGGDYNQPQGRPVSAQYYGGGYSQPQGQSVSSPIYGGENENKAPGQSPPFSPGQRTHENPAYPSEDNNSFSQNISQTSSAANSNPEVSPEISSGRLKEEHKPAGTANPYPKALVPSSDAEAQTGESNVLNSYNHPKEDFSWSNAGGSGNKLGSAENKGSRDSSNSYSGISATGSSNKYVNSGDTHLSAYGSSTLNLGNNSSLVAPAAFNSPGQSNSANLSGSKTALETPKHSQSPFLNSTNSASLNHTTPPSLNLTNNSIHSPISSSTVRQVGIPGNGTAPITSGIPINGSASEPVQHAHLKKVCKVMGFSITGGVAAFLVLAAVTTFFRRRALKKRNLKAEISVPRLQPSVNGIEVSETGIADTTKNSMQELASEVRSQNHGSVELGRGNYGHHASYASSFGNSDETDLEQNYYLEDQSDRHDDLVYELNIDRPMPEAYEYDTGLELAENDIGYNILDANFEFLNEEPFPQHFERNFDDMTQVQTEYSNDDSVFEGNRR
ncbi:hypothetical protein BY996DRAFT_6740717 [Phakopsora pachyrhizi]|nr:hypothetical protein BY996DRAFT_6740717 [Phakopsora pachyrhizi]